MEIETETVKIIHIGNQGFDWRYVVKENPEYPLGAILIEHHEENKFVQSVSIPKEVIPNLIELLEYFK